MKSLLPALVVSFTLISGPAQAQQTLDAEQAAFLTLINNFRAQNGAGPLQVSVALQSSSQWMSTDMAGKNYFSHTDSLGRSPGTRLAAFGYPFFPWGENIAAGYADAQDTLNQWATACDPDASGACTYAHRLNMINPSFVVIGIGRAYSASSTYGWYWTTDFGGVLDQTINPPTSTAPTIASFGVSPAAISPGQAATLSWSVSGATSVSLDNGIGDVSNVTSESVSPFQTTTYKLTASNNTGTATAVVTLTVNSTPPDTQPPTAPGIVSVIAKSANEVDITWSASADNVGVAGYQVIRNGSVLASLAGSVLSYADTSASANTTYTYNVKAFDAAGNYSIASNSAQVTTPAPPVSSGCPGASTNAFTGCYYNNTTLTGNPVLIRTDNAINFDWRTSSPGNSVSPLNFSVRWQGIFSFNQGNYTFTAITSDGMRVYIDGNIVLDRWRDQPPNLYTILQSLSQGNHLIVVEYYEDTGGATAHLDWQSNSPSGPQIPTISSFTAAPSTITAGQASTLSWTVSGASSITLDNGIGDVSNATSKTVSPLQTTTYKLVARNSAGTATASVTVTVNATPDTLPPTAPSIISAVAKNSNEVDIAWSPSTDNVGVAGYQVIRNGSVLTSVAGTITSFADTSASANTTYTYIVKAFDAAANYSNASNAVQVTTPAAPASASCLVPGSNSFTGCYYNNITLSSNPVLVRTDNQINFDWQFNAPDPSVTGNSFSVRWQGNFTFDQGSYTFTAITSDGMRIYIDGNIVLDRWRDQPPYIYTIQSTLSQGNHLIVVEYYEHTGSATAHLSWRKN